MTCGSGSVCTVSFYLPLEIGPDLTCALKVVNKYYSLCNSRIPLIQTSKLTRKFPGKPAPVIRDSDPVSGFAALGGCALLTGYTSILLICPQYHRRRWWAHRSSLDPSCPQVCGCRKFSQDCYSHLYVGCKPLLFDSQTPRQLPSAEMSASKLARIPRSYVSHSRGSERLMATHGNQLDGCQRRDHPQRYWTPDLGGLQRDRSVWYSYQYALASF